MFANIDKPQLSAFKDNLKKHAVIDKQNKLNRKALLQYQPTQSTMQHCLDKLNLYNTSQDELSIEALLLVCKLGIILFGPRDEAKKQCIALCKKLSDDHWLFLKQLLKQQYEGQHIQALFERKLASFNAQEKSIALSKDYLQHLAISLSDSSDNEQESLLKSLLKNT